MKKRIWKRETRRRLCEMLLIHIRMGVAEVWMCLYNQAPGSAIMIGCKCGCRRFFNPCFSTPLIPCAYTLVDEDPYRA